jgi:HEAT repeat protein
MASGTLVENLIQTLSTQSKSPPDFHTESLRARAADALGSLQDPTAVPALIEALNDPNYVCVCAANALAQIKDSRAVEPLVRVLQNSDKFWVPRGAAAVALGLLGELAKSALPALREALQYDCTDENDEKWDLRAREAVEDAVLHITNPSAECSLKGRGYRFEMWGIY